MARILGVLLALFITTTAYAQTARPIHGGASDSGLTRNELAFDNTTFRSLTGSFASGVNVIRVFCSVSCFIAQAATGSGGLLAATTATGVLINAGEFYWGRARSGETIGVIGRDNSGTLYINEFTR